ncbi:citrate synthase [Elizabethkingia anophelis]|uniref:Citrate synthase n=3 Tax=Elizabethkingia anophelis TaxID=1117645 RepID=X5KW98_9FLAO|nr:MULTISPECIES: citrate synthase [Elizabethkingia]AIL47405.1 Citrate synthase (si) [Elizabethkingia anophelis NUHP1]AKH95913.1 type II citrate synthase [Elizabethkingia anophelis FMS-007]AMR41910.1 citrate (Si)-synthase [Elizabethkingia anophelis]AMX48551.1 citrate (Si)-synthase [Elizabethkingia anophelis]AMX52008.1 citrate (Si)-synthase [Elizabethkingia anophelis]
MSDNKVVLNYDGQAYEYPIVESTLGDRGIDISKLRDQTGLITLDLGYKNTGATISEITYLDGDQGELFYRGYPIEQIAEKSNFTEVMYLLLNGELPNKEQFSSFENNIKKYNFIADEMKKIIDVFPRSAHPMGVLSSLTSALTAFNPKAVDVSSKEDLDHAAELMIAKFAHLCAWTYRKTQGLPLNHGDNKLNYVENFYKMAFRLPNEEFELDPVVVGALDKLLILHADHEQNCSTSTVRMVGSAHTGLFASISAGVSALWGPLHGGANQAVIEMLEMIDKDGGDVSKYVAKAKDKNDNFRLMGFGHRVYKNFDPRAKIIKKAADDILGKLGIQDKALDIAMQLEKVALEDDYFVERKLYPNVDFYSGIIYRALGIPTEMFTVMFALGRLPGWIAQWKEMRLKGDPIGRPRQVYQGAKERNYVPMENR